MELVRLDRDQLVQYSVSVPEDLLTFYLISLHYESRSGDGIVSHGNIPALLPPTLRELHAKYAVVGAQSSAPSVRAAVPMPESIQVGKIVDLMLAVLTAAEFDHFMVFKLFESFPEVGVVLLDVVCGYLITGVVFRRFVPDFEEMLVGGDIYLWVWF